MKDTKNTLEQMFFELLQVAIGRIVCLSHSPSAEEWKGLYEIAKKQSLVGVCFAGVQKLVEQQQTPEEMLYLTWMGMAAKIQQRNEVVNQQCVEVQRLIAEKGCRSCIIKGQSNHTSYGSLAMLRQSGDIDIWVEGGREKVVELVSSICPTKEIRETHAQLRVFQDTEVEVHYRPGLIRDFRRNKRLQAFFASHAEDCFANRVSLGSKEFQKVSSESPKTPETSGTSKDLKPSETLSIVAPKVQFHAVQQLLHIYHHLFDSGIGLRQVMDYYFVLKHLSEEEKGGVMKVLKQVGVERFAKALMFVEQKVFGLEDRYLLCEPSVEDGEYLLSEIMIGGNFGHYDDRKKYSTRHSFLESFLGVYFKNFRHARFAPMEWFWSPIWRLYYFGWRKWNGYE
jgi:hypothetical protein